MPRSPRAAEPESAPNETPAAEKTPLEQFIDVFHEDWKALPLTAKLAKIGGTLGNIPKRGYNRAQNYRFTQETDLVSAVRPYLAATGILITFSLTEHEIIPRPNPDAKGLLTRVRLHWTVTDGKESLHGDMDGYGMDAGDKGIYKAITGAKKYILMTLFLVDTGDDAEADTKTDRDTMASLRDVVAGVTTRRNPPPDHGGPLEPEPPAPVVGPLNRPDAVRGGHSTESTDIQRARFIEAVRIRGWTALQLLAFLRVELGTALLDAPEDDPSRLRGYISELLNSLSSSDMGQLLVGIERGE